MDAEDELVAGNLAVFLEDGPALSMRYSTWVKGVDLNRGAVLLGGCGGLGVGTMWVEWRSRTKLNSWWPLLDTAPEVDAPPYSTGNYPSGDAAELAHWRNKAIRGEHVLVTCANPDRPCGTNMRRPDDRAEACPFCTGPVSISELDEETL